MKKILRTLSMALALTLFTACSSGENNDVQSDLEEEKIAGEDIEDATELDFWTFAGTHADFFVDAANRWNDEFPDRSIKLNAQTYPFEQMHNNLLLAIQSGEGVPDLADIEIAKFSNFLQGEVQLESLNEYIEPELGNFIEERLDIYAKDGLYYGAPTHLGATVVFYNTEYMDEAGVDIDSIETWDDYVEAGKKVVNATDKPMTTIPISWYGFWPFVTQRGSDLFDDDGELIIDNETNVDTLEFLHSMVYDDEIAEISPGGNYHTEEFYGYMNDGGSASIIVPLFYMKDFLEYMPDLENKMAIRAMPVFEEGDAKSVPMGGTGTVVPSNSGNEELAKDFLNYAKLTKEGNINLWTELGFDPPRWDVWESPELQEDNEYYQYFDDTIFDTLIEIRDDIEGLNINEYTPDAIDELGTNILHDVLRENTETPEESLKKGAETIKSYMQ